MNRQVVLTLRIKHDNLLIAIDQPAGVTDLSTHLGIERCLIEDNLIEGLVLLFYLTITQDLSVTLEEVITDEVGLALFQDNPVASLNRRGITCPLFLLLHLDVELVNIGIHPVLTKDQLRQVQGETISIVKRESIDTTDPCLACRLSLFHLLIKQTDTCLQSPEESILFLLDHTLDQGLLCLQLRISVTHRLNQHGQELIHESGLAVEEGITVTNGTTQDTTDHVTCLSVRRQLTIGNSESDGPDMVGDHTHRYIFLLVDTISGSSHVCDHLDDGLEDIGIIV